MANVGGVYYANRDGERRFYNCSNKKKYGTKYCNNKNISLKRIDALIEPERYRNDMLKTNIEYAQELITLAYKLTKSINADEKDKVNELNIEIENFQERKNRVINMYEMGHIEEIDFTKRIEPINKHILELEKQRDQFSKNNKEILEDLCELGETTKQFRTDYEVLTNQSLKEFKRTHSREDIVKDVKEMVINTDDTVSISYKSFEKYYKLREKHKELLDIYVKKDEVERFIEDIRK